MIVRVHNHDGSIDEYCIKDRERFTNMTSQLQTPLGLWIDDYVQGKEYMIHPASVKKIELER